MSTYDQTSTQDRRRHEYSAARAGSVAIAIPPSSVRRGRAILAGGLAGAVAGLAAGAAGSLLAPNLALPVLTAMGVFFGVFNGALLGAIAPLGDQRPA